MEEDAAKMRCKLLLELPWKAVEDAEKSISRYANGFAPSFSIA
jgi:hypothetical protein